MHRQIEFFLEMLLNFRWCGVHFWYCGFVRFLVASEGIRCELYRGLVKVVFDSPNDCIACIDLCTLTISERSSCCTNECRRELHPKHDVSKDNAKTGSSENLVGFITWLKSLLKSICLRICTGGLFLLVLHEYGSSIRRFDLRQPNHEHKLSSLGRVLGRCLKQRCHSQWFCLLVFGFTNVQCLCFLRHPGCFSIFGLITSSLSRVDDDDVDNIDLTLFSSFSPFFSRRCSWASISELFLLLSVSE